MIKLSLHYWILLTALLPLLAMASASSVRFEQLFKVRDVIWGFDFLPDGKVIFTEREGRISIFDPQSKKITPLKGIPKVHAAGQGGMLDIKLDPDFQKNQRFFFTYAEPQGKLSATVLAEARLKENELVNFRKVFTANAEEIDVHYGSRILIKDDHIYFTVGDRYDRSKVQDLRFHNGKVLRLSLDGSTPKDNPFSTTKEARPEIFALGIRSPQGLALHPTSKEIFEAEMGPQGGDEVNVIEAGKNYGWPVITYGREYHGPKIGKTKKEGMEQPIVYWVPSISPSGISFYEGKVYPDWNENLFLATLSGEHVRRLVLQNRSVIRQEILLADLKQRWRSIRQGPDGYLYLGSDSGLFGRLIKGK